MGAVYVLSLVPCSPFALQFITRTYISRTKTRNLKHRETNRRENQEAS